VDRNDHRADVGPHRVAISAEMAGAVTSLVDRSGVRLVFVEPAHVK
jgi:hypothetical protein